MFFVPSQEDSQVNDNIFAITSGLTTSSSTICQHKMSILWWREKERTGSNIQNQTFLFSSTLAKTSTPVFPSCLITNASQKISNGEVKQKKLQRNSLSNGYVSVCIPKRMINRNRKVDVQMHMKMFPHWTLVPLVYHLCHLLFSASETRFPSSFSAKIKFIRKCYY